MSRRESAAGVAAILGVLAAGVGAPGVAVAHQIRPAYLEVAESAPERYELRLVVPLAGEERLPIHVRLPVACRPLGSLPPARRGEAALERWSVACDGGLAGRALRVDNLAATGTDVLVRFEPLAGPARTVRLHPRRPAWIVAAAPGRLEIAGAYLRLGIEHILGGIDHLLFVLALLLIVRGGWRLVRTVTAFTVAHSITLALAVLGLVRPPGPPVEAVIALSILLLAGELAHERMGRAGFTARAPWVVAFTFGLLHGFGFAGALRAVGLPDGEIPLALLLFNVGVEVGQLLFVAAFLGLAAGWRRWGAEWVRWPRWAWRLPVYSIGALAAFWVIRRVAQFF